MTEQATGKLSLGRIALGVGALAAGAAIGVALHRGQGNSVGAPPAAIASANAGLADPFAALQARVAENPADGPGWRALAEEQFTRGAFADAVAAFEKAAAITPDEAAAWSSLGEARVMASAKDPLPAQALADFRKAQAIDAHDPRSRYFMAVHRDLGGDHQGAISDWLALLKDSPDGAPWKADLRRTIEQVGKVNGIDVAARLSISDPAPKAAPVNLPGPSAADLAAAGSIPPSEQKTMAEGMVARLEARLKTQPGNLDGWVMLMRSRITLAQPDKAAAALKDAIAANPGKEVELRMAAQQLGIR